MLARSIYEVLIEPADVLLDLHGGDQVEALEPFAIYGASPVEERADEIAVAFNLPYVVREEPKASGLGGMTTSAAAQAGIPGVIAEAGGRGLLEQSATAMLAAGVRNVLQTLGMIPGEPDPPPARQRRVGSFVWLHSTEGGWWQWEVEAGEEVSAGQLPGASAICGATCAKRLSRRRTASCCSSPRAPQSRRTGSCSDSAQICELRAPPHDG